MKKKISFILSTVLVISTISGCKNTNLNNKETDFNKINETKISSNEVKEILDQPSNFSYNINPDTFELSVNFKDKTEMASKPLDAMVVNNFKQEDTITSWDYPDNSINVKLEKQNDYLDVNIKYNENKESSFVWPKVVGKNYMIPLWEGKSIPNDDVYWKDYLNEMNINTIESLSMGFFAVNHENYSIVYIIENIFNNKIKFDTSNNIEFSFEHEYTKINSDKEYGFRIYVTENDPVQIAKIYKNYIMENGKFKTLSEKAKYNKNIEKLYGAIHVYLWDETVISEDDVNWQKFRNQSSNNIIKYITKLLDEYIEDGNSTSKIIETISNQDYVDNYQKTTICQSISKLLLLDNFYNENIFIEKDSIMEQMISKGIANLNQAELIEFNKRALSMNTEDIFKPVETWSNDRNLDIVKDIKNSGIDNAWLGLSNWIQGFISPSMVKFANDNGYLIGPYDSYHSIHEPDKSKWNTAEFTDKTLYENATVTDKNGKKVSGFQNVGRKLNPTLSLPSVKERVTNILNTGIDFNSWFIDCDATGEIYDDYSSEHITTQNEDLNSRLERMSYIRDNENMVIGSEGGNDFSSSTIAFAHGIELPSFSWMDNDMKKNKDSEYYIGRYYSSKGGVPEIYSKQIPIKDEYKKIFLDPAYNLPLFKLVYNDSVITTYHWEWSTLKIKDEVENRQLYEILYNIPPLYHIDKFEWEKHKDEIVEHSKTYSNFSKEVINEEMTDFNILSNDRLIQMTEYGNKIKVVANFSEQDFNYENDIIKSHSLIIYKKDAKNIYQKIS